MSTSPVARIAAVLVALEGVAIAALVIWEIVAIAQGDTDWFESAIALLVLSAVFAAAVIAFAVAIWRGRSWGRSGGIVTQVLIFAIALGAATGAYAHPVIGLWIGLPAVVTFVLLILAARQAGRAGGEASDRS